MQRLDWIAVLAVRDITVLVRRETLIPFVDLFRVVSRLLDMGNRFSGRMRWDRGIWSTLLMDPGRRVGAKME
jgi:hypothetical protein